MISLLRKHSKTDITGNKFSHSDEVSLLLDLGFRLEADEDDRTYVIFAPGTADNEDLVFFHKAVSMMLPPTSRTSSSSTAGSDYWMRVDEDYDRCMAMMKGQHMGGYQNGDGRRGSW
jgi:hypothetical protein